MLMATPDVPYLNIVYLIFGFGILGAVGSAASTINISGALLARWFRKRRATALGISTAGASVGGLLLVPLTAYLVQQLDWRTTWMILGIIVLGFGFPLSFFLLRNDPADMGLRPDGERDTDAQGKPTPPAQPTPGPLELDYWKASLKSGPFWQLSTAYFACGATTSIMSFHFIPYAQEKGMEPATAALAFGLMSGLNVVGLLGATALADKFPRKNLLALVYGGRALGYLMLFIVPAPLVYLGLRLRARLLLVGHRPADHEPHRRHLWPEVPRHLERHDVPLPPTRRSLQHPVRRHHARRDWPLRRGFRCCGIPPDNRRHQLLPCEGTRILSPVPSQTSGERIGRRLTPYPRAKGAT